MADYAAMNIGGLDEAATIRVVAVSASGRDAAKCRDAARAGPWTTELEQLTAAQAWVVTELELADGDALARLW
jgi:hypothetical protein